MKKDIKSIIAANIKRFRSEAKLTQKDLGLSLGFTEDTAQARIHHYEKGLRTPNSSTLDKMAGILNKPANAFFDEESGQHEHRKAPIRTEHKDDQLTFEVSDQDEQEFVKLRREAAKYGKDVVEKIESYSRWMIEEAKKKKATRSSGATTSAHTRMVKQRGRKAGS